MEKALVTHFKILHLLQPNSIYRCVEGNCSQTFQCLGSFKRHIMRKHYQNPVITTPSVSNDQSHIFQSSSLSQNINCEQSNNLQSENDDTFFNPEVNFNLDQDINSLYESAITFIISLHNHNNFTKKDVNKIQSDII